MKTTITILTVALMIVTASSFAQTIRRVNNNPGITLDANMYSTLQAAHDAAVAGDVIYLEASATAYGDLTSTKQLTIVGTGYLLNENHIYAHSTQPARVGNVTLKAGASGSVVEGLKIEGTLSTVRASNVTIRRNYFTGGHLYIYATESGQQTTYSSVSSISVVGNIMNAVYVYPAIDGVNNYTVSSLTIANNWLSSLGYSNNGPFEHLVTSAAVYNNVFGSGFSKVWNTSIHNNVFVTPSSCSLDYSGSNNTITNNLSAAVGCLPAGNGNVNGIILVDTFVGSTGNTYDGQWKLKPGSAAIGAGVGGVDCGMYGGATPYVLSGIPAHPTINTFNTTGVGNSTTPLEVTISTKSNN